MDDGASMSNSVSGISCPSGMNWDFVDELMYQGFWVESSTDQGFSISQPAAPSTSDVLQCDPSYSQPMHLMGSSYLTVNSHQRMYQEETDRSCHGTLQLDFFEVERSVETQSHTADAVETSKSIAPPNCYLVEGAQLGRGQWIGSRVTLGPSYSVRDRLLQALGYMKSMFEDKEILIQIWLLIKKGGKNVLTTIDQPYLISSSSENLTGYRNVSQTCQFLAEEDSKELIGFPGQVVLEKLPEWTPDVRLFTRNEYPLKEHAKRYNICGSLALPIMERDSGTCLGIIENAMTAPKITCRPELEDICKALEAVDLKSSQDFCPPVQSFNSVYQVAVPEIYEISQSVCNTYRLPLALTWAPCARQGKSACCQFPEKFASCISTVDSACFVADQDYSGFRVACSEQYLFLGQGIVGRAFQMEKQCFATDVSAFSKTTYPLAHHASIFDLHAAMAIPLRSIYTGAVEFVLEFFLPKDCHDTQAQKQMWDSLSTVVQQACRSLLVVFDKELEQKSKWRPATGLSTSKEPFSEESSWISRVIDAQKKGKCSCVSLDCPKKEPEEEFRFTTYWEDSQEEVDDMQVLSELKQTRQNSETKSGIQGGTPSSLRRRPLLGGGKPSCKRRYKMEKTISLQVLRQYFAGSLKDAAKSIGVCPTTLKRICRQHGITRWPSRKIKKVGHSLKKLQRVIDSVQGSEGTIRIGSFYSTFPELGSPKFPDTAGPSSSFKMSTDDNSKPLNTPPDVSGSHFSSHSKSSGCSSTCCSNGVLKCSGNALEVQDSPAGDELIMNTKRTYSTETESHAFSREESMPSEVGKRSSEHPGMEASPSFQVVKATGRSLTEGGGFRVKVSFGEERVRLCTSPNWGFGHLQQEIAKRFNLEDMTRMDLKYLDDDGEWVRLASDADLEECKEIHRLSESSVVNISLHQDQAPQPHLGTSWFGCEGPCQC